MTSESDPAVVLVLGTGLVDLLVNLAGQLQAAHEDLVAGGGLAGAGDAVAADDRDAPMWARLYPATSDDEATDGELRELLHHDLAEERSEELAVLARLLQDGDVRDDEVHLALDADQAATMLRTTHVLMLALAVRANREIFTGRDQRLSPPDPSTATGMMTAIVDSLQVLHEHVLAQLDPGSRSHYDHLGQASGDTGTGRDAPGDEGAHRDHDDGHDQPA